MKLVDLAPRWWADTDGVRLGVSFACPVHAAGGLDAHGSADCVLGRVYVRTEMPSGPGANWTRAGDAFESMSLSPSVKCTVPQGVVHWHGFVTNGDVTVLDDSDGRAWPDGSPT